MTFSNWRKSSYSFANGNCTEVATSGSGVLVRDSKAASTGPVLRFTAAGWTAFLLTVREDRP